MTRFRGPPGPVASITIFGEGHKVFIIRMSFVYILMHVKLIYFLLGGAKIINYQSIFLVRTISNIFDHLLKNQIDDLLEKSFSEKILHGFERRSHALVFYLHLIKAFDCVTIIWFLSTII